MGASAQRRELGLGIATNYAVLAVRVGFVLASAPLIIDQAGSDVFGAWAVVLAVRAFLAVADFAIDPGIARSVAAAEPARRPGVMSAGARTLAVAGVAVGLAGAVAAAALPALIADASSLGPALGLLAAGVCVEMPLNVFAHGLFGTERIWQRNAFVMLRYLLAVIGLAIALELDGGLVAIVAGVLAGEIVALIAQAGFCLVRLPELRPVRTSEQRAQMRDLVAYSVPAGGLVLAAGLAFSSGPLIAGAALGAGAAAIYGLAVRILEGMMELVGRFAEVFLPRFAIYEAGGAAEQSASLLRAGTLACIALGVPLAGAAVGFGEPLIQTWVGDDFRDSWVPLSLLACALALHAPVQFAITWALGSARHGPVARLSLCGGLAAAGLGLALVGPLEEAGIALGLLVGLAPFDVWLIPAVVSREAGVRLATTFIRPLVAALLLVAPLSLAERLWLAPAVEDSGAALVATSVLITTAAVAATGLLLRRVAQR